MCSVKCATVAFLASRQEKQNPNYSTQNVFLGSIKADILQTVIYSQPGCPETEFSLMALKVFIHSFIHAITHTILEHFRPICMVNTMLKADPNQRK